MLVRPDPVAPPWIVVINDDTAVRNSLKFALEIVGYIVSVYPAAWLPQVEERLGQAACLVVDHELAPVRGLELLLGLRARGQAIPAVLTTVQLAMHHLQRARDAGISVVYKPILGDVLFQAIQLATGIPNGNGDTTGSY